MHSSYSESFTLITYNTFIMSSNFLHKLVCNNYLPLTQKREVANVVLKDLIGLYLTWRQIRGYPSKGQTTHTNSKTSRKTKLLMYYRLDQFYKVFGNKKRNVYPTLIKAEYTNRLWFNTWVKEWKEANRFAMRMANLKGRGGNNFNPALLADNQTNGYVRVGKAAKIGKAKKLVKVFTLGVPVFFSRYIYYPHPPHGFPVKLVLKDEVNKKLGKKVKRNKKK